MADEKIQSAMLFALFGKDIFTHSNEENHFVHKLAGEQVIDIHAICDKGMHK